MWKFEYFKPYLSPGSIVSFLFLLITLVSGTYIINNEEFSANIVNKAATQSCNLCLKNAEPGEDCSSLCSVASAPQPKNNKNEDNEDPVPAPQPATQPSGSCTQVCLQNATPDECGCGGNVPSGIIIPPSGQTGSNASTNNDGIVGNDYIGVINSNPGNTNPSVTPTPTSTCSANGATYAIGSNVIGGTGTGSSGYATCTSTGWDDCPSCTILDLTTVPTHLQTEYNNAVQEVINQQNLANLEATELEVSRIACDQSDGTWTGSVCIDSAQTFITVERDEDGTTRELTTIYRDQNNNAVGYNITPVTISSSQTVEKTDDGFDRNLTTYVRDEETGEIVNAITQNIAPVKKQTGDYCSYGGECGSGRCDYTTGSPVKRCVPQTTALEDWYNTASNQSFLENVYDTTNALTFGYFGDYIDSFSNPNNILVWQQQGYSSSEEAIQDCVNQNGINSAYSCMRQMTNLGSEQVTSSVMVGTILTSEAALLATGAGYGAGALTGTQALMQGVAISSLYQTGSATNTCINNPGSDECQIEATWAAISWINVGSAANLTNAIATGSQQAITTAQYINTGVNVLNLAGDVGIDVVNNCYGANQNDLGCAIAIGATALDLGGGVFDLAEIALNSNVVNNALQGLGDGLGSLPTNSVADDLAEAVLPDNLLTQVNTPNSPIEMPSGVAPSVGSNTASDINVAIDYNGSASLNDFPTNQTGVTTPINISGNQNVPDINSNNNMSDFDLAMSTNTGSSQTNTADDFVGIWIETDMPSPLAGLFGGGSPVANPLLATIDLQILTPTTPKIYDRISSLIDNMFIKTNVSQIPTSDFDLEVRINPDSLDIINDPAFQRLKQKGIDLREANSRGDYVLNDEIRDLAQLRNNYLSSVVDDMTIKQREWGKASRYARSNDLVAPRLQYDRLSEIVMSVPNESASFDFLSIQNAALRYDYPGDLEPIKFFIDSRGGTVTRREILDYVADQEVGLIVNKIDDSLNVTDEFAKVQNPEQDFITENILVPIQNLLDDGTLFGDDALLTVGGGTYKSLGGQKLVINPNKDASLQKYLITTRQYLEQNRTSGSISRADLLNDYVHNTFRYANPDIEYSGATQLREQIYAQNQPAYLGQFINGNTGVCREFAACLHVALADTGKPNYMTVADVDSVEGLSANQEGGRHAWVEYIDSRTGEWMVADPTVGFVLPRDQAYKEKYVNVHNVERQAFVWPDGTSWWKRLTQKVNTP